VTFWIHGRVIKDTTWRFRNSASSRLTFVHSVSRFHGHVSLSCSAFLSRARPAFPSLVPTPDETSYTCTYPRFPSFARSVGRGHPVCHLFCQLVGRSVGCGLPGESESDGAVFFFCGGGGFVVVMYTMCRFIGFVCLFVAWLHRDKRLDERLVG
jgi:hypothetical protein